MGKIFYVIGKSASGKDSLCAALRGHFGEALKNVVGYTTRPIRSGETEGDPYHFITQTQLQKFRLAGRVIESRTYETVHGPWTYATLDDGSFCPDGAEDCLTVGTPESYRGMLRYYGKDVLVPLYIEVEDGIRLERALQRERRQTQPKYAELCRRFLADEADFSAEKLAEIEPLYRFDNTDFETCLTALIQKVNELRTEENLSGQNCSGKVNELRTMEDLPEKRSPLQAEKKRHRTGLPEQEAPERGGEPCRTEESR